MMADSTMKKGGSYTLRKGGGGGVGDSPDSSVERSLEWLQHLVEEKENSKVHKKKHKKLKN